jgi:hypothetical protein
VCASEALLIDPPPVRLWAKREDEIRCGGQLANFPITSSLLLLGPKRRRRRRRRRSLDRSVRRWIKKSWGRRIRCVALMTVLLVYKNRRLRLCQLRAAWVYWNFEERARKSPCTNSKVKYSPNATLNKVVCEKCELENEVGNWPQNDGTSEGKKEGRSERIEMPLKIGERLHGTNLQTLSYQLHNSTCMQYNVYVHVYKLCSCDVISLKSQITR